MDDVPLGFYADEKDAIRVADKISFRAAYKIARNLDIDCSTPICFAVVPFENGTPTNMFVLDREDDAGRTISTSPVQRALRTQRKKTDSDRRRR